MKKLLIILLLLLFITPVMLFSQTNTSPKLFAHKVVVEEVLQTSNYTYLRVKEVIKGKDSMQWMAAPKFTPAIGDTYYFESGLQMGEFKSKELERTFNPILFIGEISTNPEIGGVNMLAGIPIAPADTTQKKLPPRVLHTVVIKEVIQTSGYSYLRVKEGEKESWLALVKVPVKVGQVVSYDDASPMSEFTSKELKRTFKEVLFISSLKLVSDGSNKEAADAKMNKKQAKNSPPPTVISLAKLLENKKSYAGKTVSIKGQVTKYSSDILSKNWIHIEDGTGFEGKSDLTVTLTDVLKVGDNVTVTGKIHLDKDFGSGYFFDIIMEDAVLLAN